jgi:hypothetical protein
MEETLDWILHHKDKDHKVANEAILGVIVGNSVEIVEVLAVVVVHPEILEILQLS